MRRRREFYAARPSAELPCERGEARGEERRAVFAPDEVVEVRLQYCPRGTGGPGGPVSGSAAPQVSRLPTGYPLVSRHCCSSPSV